MFGNRELIRCQERKAALLRQSAAHRLVLVREARTLRPVAGWVDLGLGLVRKVRTGWSVLAPLLSSWRTPQQESSGFVQKIMGGISIARSLSALWQSRR